MIPQSQGPSRAIPLALAIAAALLSSGCATTAKDLPEWPPKPEKPRVRFLRWIQKEGDLEQPFLRKVWRVLVPASPKSTIRQPLGLALSPDGKRLYVANGRGQAVVAVDLESGSFSVTGAARGHSPGYAAGVALDADENLYVADGASNKVLVFDRGGSFLRELGVGKLDKPRALALDRKRQLLYVLNGVSAKSQEHRVDVFALKGDHLRTIGKRGSDQGEFNFPSSLGVAADGRLFVVDMLNFRVQVFDPDGRFQTSFGQIGAGEPGSFDKARGLAFDTFGNVYVTEAGKGYVQVFNPVFQPLMAFGGRYVGQGYLALPAPIVIDGRNHIFVGDAATGIVSEYELFNTTAEDSMAPAPAGASPAPPPGAQPAPAPPSEKAQGG